MMVFDRFGRLLVIEGATFPFGWGIPAGHVDEHGGFEDAAVAELSEEVGLTVKSLVLVTEGRRENVCRRRSGDWHLWKVYEATCSGEIRLEPREAKSFRWCAIPDLVNLGLVREPEVAASIATTGKIELSWFSELKPC